MQFIDMTLDEYNTWARGNKGKTWFVGWVNLDNGSTGFIGEYATLREASQHMDKWNSELRQMESRHVAFVTR